MEFSPSRSPTWEILTSLPGDSTAQILFGNVELEQKIVLACNAGYIKELSPWVNEVYELK